MSNTVTRIFASSHYAQCWHEFDGVHATGAIHDGTSWLSGQALADAIRKAIVSGNIPETLRSWNGSFAFIARQGDRVIAAVDWMRSFPLFWAETNKGMLVGNNAWELVRTGELDRWNKPAGQEFSTAGFVGGNETLTEGLCQLQAGQLLEVGASGSTKVSFWDTDIFTNDQREESLSLDQAMKKLDVAYDALSFRLVDFLDGRQAVVPLSGGYDSRCILWMLHKRGYDNVFTFTYGRKGNFEAQVAKEVAATFGYPWQLLEYTPEMWHGLYDRADFRFFFAFANNFCSLPHESDFFALQQLRDGGLLDENAIHLPGHTPLAPSQVMQRWDSPMTWKNLHKRIWKLSYSLCRDLSREASNNLCRQRVVFPKDMTEISPENFFELWHWRNPETKYIFNSQRSIEFFGWSWYFPLADRELAELYWNMPTRYYYKKTLFNQFVERMGRKYGLPMRKDPPPNLAKKVIKKTLLHIGLDSWMRRQINRQKLQNHPICFYDIVPACKWNDLEVSNSPGQSYVTQAALKEIKATIKGIEK